MLPSWEIDLGGSRIGLAGMTKRLLGLFLLFEKFFFLIIYYRNFVSELMTWRNLGHLLQIEG